MIDAQAMPRIFLIEDNPENRDLLSRRLQRHGFDVIAARADAEGIEMAQLESPDLILLDRNMPDMNGWEVARRLKVDSQTQSLPIIAITAHDVAGNRELMLDIGSSDYHTKPVELSKLLIQVENILRDTPTSSGESR